MRATPEGQFVSALDNDMNDASPSLATPSPPDRYCLASAAASPVGAPLTVTRQFEKRKARRVEDHRKPGRAKVYIPLIGRCHSPSTASGRTHLLTKTHPVLGTCPGRGRRTGLSGSRPACAPNDRAPGDGRPDRSGCAGTARRARRRGCRRPAQACRRPRSAPAAGLRHRGVRGIAAQPLRPVAGQVVARLQVDAVHGATGAGAGARAARAAAEVDDVLVAARGDGVKQAVVKSGRADRDTAQTQPCGHGCGQAGGERPAASEPCACRQRHGAEWRQYERRRTEFGQMGRADDAVLGAGAYAPAACPARGSVAVPSPWRSSPAASAAATSNTTTPTCSAST